jgi:hypothetical protein
MRATALILVPILALALAGATPAAAQRSGTYAVVGTGAGGGQQYEGAAQLQATGPQTWTLTWRISGETTRGVGMSDGDRLVVGYVSRGATGVAIYCGAARRVAGRHLDAGHGRGRRAGEAAAALSASPGPAHTKNRAGRPGAARSSQAGARPGTAAAGASPRPVPQPWRAFRRGFFLFST